jgi:hypothetical protein
MSAVAMGYICLDTMAFLSMPEKFGYSGDGGRHFFNPEVSSNLVIIGTASLLNDIAIAVTTYMDACRADIALRQRAERRLPHVIKVFPHPK